MSGTELEPAVQAEIERMVAQQNAAFDSDGGVLQIPLLKVGQGTSKEVKADDAEIGDFIDSVTGQSLGTAVDFIPAVYERGRALNRRGKPYLTTTEEIIPESWGDAVGEQWVNTPFSEHPDAEEQYRERVNAGEQEWESGPSIQTNHVYTGLVIVSAVEDSDEEDEVLEMRIGFKSAGTKTHNKIKQLQRMKMRNKPLWSYILHLSTEVKDFSSGSAAMVNVKLGDKTPDDLAAQAFNLARLVLAGRVEEKGEDIAEAPEVKGGLGV